MDQLLCLEVPLSPYIKEWRRRRGSAPMAHPGGVLLPPGVGFLPFHVVGVGDKEGEREEKEGGGAAPPLVQFGLVLGGGARPASPSPLKPSKAHILVPRIPVTPRYYEIYPNHSEPFRCPNIVVQYIDLYVSTISRLLVMSPISSRTLNYLGTSKHINS